MRFELKVVIGFVVTLSLVVLLGIYTYHNNQNQLHANRWLTHTHKVLYQSEQLLRTLTEAEAEQRGYCLTGHEDFLGPYLQAKESLNRQVSYLQYITKDNPRQQVRTAKLQSLIQQKIVFCSQAIALKKPDLTASMTFIASLKGKQLMDQIKQTFNEFLNEEKKLLEQRRLETEKQAARFNVLFIVTLALTVLILLVLFYTIYINLRARKKAEQHLVAAAKNIQDLYDNAPCGYHSLDAEGLILEMNHTMLDWLGYKREELIGQKRISEMISSESLDTFRSQFPVLKKQGFIYNIDCTFIRKDGSSFPGLVSSSAIQNSQGDFIRSRSTTVDFTEQKHANEKIINLNQELEAFTYTVSHDLRSPLRSITGYAQILQEDYAPKLDSEGQRITGVIIKSSKRMGLLIDDLLNFAQLGRKELSNHFVDMNVLVKNIVKEMSAQEEHPLTIDLQHLSPSHGDLSMLRQVWINLLSNAIKYSKKKESIHITIGSQIIGNEVSYFVKDNGAGFDMQYVHKLFGVFQRLHRINEFEGTGVGLAIVKRIVTRHGGRVWADAKPDEGATFYFTIPQ